VAEWPWRMALPNMIIAPKPADERERLAALARYDVLDSEPERAYDDIVNLASQICGTPVAYVGFMDADRVWHKARLGLPFEEAARDTSFCSHTILGENPLVVPDLSSDDRFSDFPQVIGEPRIRFYAGAPLVTEDGHAVGTLCALDTKPRGLSDDQRDALAALSRQVMAPLELRRLLNISRFEAMTDPLTRLGNRRRLVEDFERLVATASSDEPLHLLLYDLDGFKGYNDTFGHGAGDTLLARLSDRLATALSERESAYRIGGDEFCVLVSGDSRRLASVRTATGRALKEHGEGFSVTASHGSVTMPDEATTLADAYRLADERMYGQKATCSPTPAFRTGRAPSPAP
jgi:diguanylate cyclase (GGDEF)-like protein